MRRFELNLLLIEMPASVIKAHALLHREHRRRTRQGSIIADIEGDYMPVRRLLGELLATASEIKMRKAVQETVAAVKKPQNEASFGKFQVRRSRSAKVFQIP